MRELSSTQIVWVPCARSRTVEPLPFARQRVLDFFSQPVVFKRGKCVHSLIGDEGEIAKVLLCFGNGFVVESTFICPPRPFPEQVKYLSIFFCADFANLFSFSSICAFSSSRSLRKASSFLARCRENSKHAHTGGARSFLFHRRTLPFRDRWRTRLNWCILREVAPQMDGSNGQVPDIPSSVARSASTVSRTQSIFGSTRVSIFAASPSLNEARTSSSCRKPCQPIPGCP